MLNIGDKIPDLFLKNQDGEIISLLEGGFPKVIYFYPKDETPGCTLEACSFRDAFEDFEDLGVKVYGISQDSVKSHKKFATNHRLNFHLLSDQKKEAEKAFGVPRTLLGLLPGRVTFIFDAGGRLIHQFNSSIRATQHVKEAIRVLKKSLFQTT